MDWKNDPNWVRSTNQKLKNRTNNKLKTQQRQNGKNIKRETEKKKPACALSLTDFGNFGIGERKSALKRATDLGTDKTIRPEA